MIKTMNSSIPAHDVVRVLWSIKYGVQFSPQLSSQPFMVERERERDRERGEAERRRQRERERDQHEKKKRGEKEEKKTPHVISA